MSEIEGGDSNVPGTAYNYADKKPQREGKIFVYKYVYFTDRLEAIVF